MIEDFSSIRLPPDPQLAEQQGLAGDPGVDQIAVAAAYVDRSARVTSSASLSLGSMPATEAIRELRRD